LDLITNQWQSKPNISNIILPYNCKFVVLYSYLLFAVGGRFCGEETNKVNVLNSSLLSPNWEPTISMLRARDEFGVAVLNNCIYAVSLKNIFIY